MKIVRSQKYTKSLQEALRFISLDSRQRALNFKHELDEKINSLDYMLYKFRQSIYFEDKTIRDLIFKGYTIVYQINEEKKIITIVGIRNTQKKL
jgi:mRNA-degrading endonuclease RelE of RelBE toxin-antitoxin system